MLQVLVSDTGVYRLRRGTGYYVHGYITQLWMQHTFGISRRARHRSPRARTKMRTFKNYSVLADIIRL
eukprot:SAG31_NODE_10626_length_1115_cov_1.336614_1_plen_67_part_10